MPDFYTYQDPHADAKRHDDDERRVAWGFSAPPRNERARIERELADGGWAWVSFSGYSARLMSKEEWELWQGGSREN